MKLSILIAAYNVEAFIEKCIKSCYDKNWANNYEIIVVNDGSKDKTLPIAESLLSKVSNLKIINKENQGLGVARNTGLLHAQGEYVWMIDGDDYLEPHTISKLWQNLDSNNDCYALNYKVVNEKGDLLYIKYPQNYITNVWSGSQYYSQYFHNSYTWQYIFRTNLFTEHNVYFKERINMQDSEILPKIMYCIKTVCYIDWLAYNYVQQEHSFTNSQNSEKRIKYFESIIEVKTSLEAFAESIRGKDEQLYNGVLKKIESLDEIVFNHLVYFKYTTQVLQKILILLKKNQMYPLKYNPSGKLKWVKKGLNINPILTKKLINYIT